MNIKTIDDLIDKYIECLKNCKIILSRCENTGAISHYCGVKASFDGILADLQELKSNMAETASKDRELLVELSSSKIPTDILKEGLEELKNREVKDLVYISYAENELKIRKHLEENPV